MSAINPFGGRKLFYSLPENSNRVSKSKFSGASKKREDSIKLVKYIDDNLIGKNVTFTGPYGRRKAVYCDYATSGRSLQFIEEFILREVLPNCGNADSTANITSLQSILYRHEAIEIFRICVNATDDDTVVFTGVGCGGPINRLLQELRPTWREPPVVFTSPCERPSMILLWKSLGAKVIRIPESKEGFLDLNDLEKQLIAHRNCGRQLIGCFSAANNITGILADDVATTLLLHQHQALAFWDYTTAAPYVQLDVNPTLPGVEESAVHKDAMFFSGHKLLGGIQTPGVLVAKKFLFQSSGSNIVGSSLLEEDERQVVVMDFQENCSTATIVEDVRAGLAMHLKQTIGVPTIMYRQEKITRTVLAHVKNIPEFVLLGNSSHSLKRLPFFSFIVRHPRGMFLHHNFVCSVLNDVFGIQVRANCPDAGSHSLDFMGIDVNLAEEYNRILQGLCDESHSQLDILRPGFCTISLPFCISDAELGFILEALKMVATEGWKLLPQYTLKSRTGEWKHHSNSMFRDRKWLGSLRYVDGKLVIPERKVSTQGTCPVDYEECLHVARCIFNKARKIAQRCPLTTQSFSFDPKVEPLRWFMLPNEAHNLLLGNSQSVRHKIPFDPNRYMGCKGDPLEGNKNLVERKPEVSRNEDSDSAANRQTNKNNFLTGTQCPTDLSLGLSEGLKHTKLHLVQNQSQNMATERQNSFSSEMSNSDYMESPTYQRGFGGPNMAPHSSMTNPADVFSYAPHPSVPSLLGNHIETYPTQLYCQQNNYPSQTNYSTQYGSSEPLKNSFSAEQMCNGFRRLNFGTMDRPQCSGKPDAQLPVNRVQFLLGRSETCARQRCNSLGSSLILNPRGRGNLGYSCRSLTDGETSLNLSECSLSSNEDIHAYVTEVTKELATEIKSEIREVISKVEDVLSDSIDVEGAAYNGSEPRGSRCFEPKCEKLERTNSLPTASANDIAQYLMGVSKEMAEEMKSEIRGLVNSVSPVLEKREKMPKIDPRCKDEKNDLGKNQVVVVNGENISQSRDSGINLSYTENLTDSKAKEKKVSRLKNVSENSKDSCSTNSLGRSDSFDFFKESERRCRSESVDSLQENEDSDATAKNQVARRKISRTSKKADKVLLSKSRLSGESSNDEAGNAGDTAKPRWCCPTKAVWKPTVEALKEFEMIQNGDKILVSLCGGRNSLAILHTLQQYKCYASSKGIHFELGAVTFGSKCRNLTDNSLITYLEGLGIPCLLEEHSEMESAQLEMNSVCGQCWKINRDRLCDIAKKRNYNVIALSQNLDDLAETFLVSALHEGTLKSLKAHYYIPKQDIRVIRPFVYVRERALRQFMENRNVPPVPENCPSCRKMSKERQCSKQLLSHQESMFPKLFVSLKSAMHPLLSCGYTEEEERLPKYATDSDETSLT